MNERDLFEACVDVLRKKKTPIHYKELTRLAFTKVNGFEPDSRVLRKIKEDVRERLLAANRMGTRYIAGDIAEGYLAEWAEDNLLIPDPIVLPVKATECLKAGIESCVRFAHIINKQNNNNRLRAERIVRGFIIEKICCHYFKSLWPENYVSADNEGEDDKWCDHDFKLKINKSIYNVDVFGMSAKGGYYKSPTKPATDVHVFGYLDEVSNCVVVQGFKSGKAIMPVNMIYEIMPISRFIVSVNMLIAGRSIKELQK